MNVSKTLALTTALLMAGLPSTSAAATYIVSGTFQRLGGPDYALLSGGSFSGTFVVADDFFPRPAGNNLYLYDAPYSIDFFNSAGQQVANSPTRPRTTPICRSRAATPTSMAASGYCSGIQARIIFNW